MAEVTDAPQRNSLYESDFFEWTRQQARLLRERRFSDLDLDNLIDEVESVGSSERREIRNRLLVLLSHLLKWQFQPGRRGESWRRTIQEQRDQLEDLVRDSPSLRGYRDDAVVRAYLGATVRAAEETGMAIGLFPDACAFSPDQVFDPSFFPEDRGFE